MRSITLLVTKTSIVIDDLIHELTVEYNMTIVLLTHETNSVMIICVDKFAEKQAKEVVEFVRTMSTVFYSLYKKQYEPEIEINDNETNNNYEPIKNAA